ncbi:MAG: hypothetical protein JST28_04765 [Acidobacteria bacterium]|nr:hypothetical protein [Acidobacteriota bacterium]
MGLRAGSFCFGLVILWSASLSSLASPTNSKLLWLVPPGAQIVSGFENYHEEHHHGQLLLTTRNNRLDLADWQAIAGVDHARVIEEVIQVASSPVGGLLHEHLLLVAGRFDQDAIFRSLHAQGAQEMQYEGQRVILVEPFSREKGLMGTRWLILIDRQLAMLGTPSIVKSALFRYLNHADVDMVIRERLSQLPLDVNSWNVLSSLPKARTEYTAQQSTNPWARFFEGADVLMVGARFGSKIRVHFALHANADRGREFLEQKSMSFAEVFSAGTQLSRPLRPRDVGLRSGSVHGAVQLSKKQFDAWSDWTNNFGHVPAVPERTVSTGQ